MNTLNRSQGFWLYLRQLLCLILTVGMVLIGFANGSLAQQPQASDPTQVPVKVKFLDPDLTENPTGGPTGGPRGHNPGTRLRVEAIALDADGNEVSCNMKYEPPEKNIAGEVVKILHQDQDNGAVLEIGPARGVARVEAFCEGYESIRDRVLVSGNGGVPPFTPTEVTPTDVRPTEITPTEIQPTEITPTEITPTEIQPTNTPPSGLGTALVIGLGAAGAAAVAIGAGSMFGGSGSVTDCGSAPQGFGNDWWYNQYVPWCECMGGTPDVATTSCNF